MSESFKEKLDNTHNWPTVYVFKFIVPDNEQKRAEVKNLFSENAEIYSKKSSKGNYISITGKEPVNNAEEVIETYKNAHAIEGLIAL